MATQVAASRCAHRPDLVQASLSAHEAEDLGLGGEWICPACWRSLEADFGYPEGGSYTFKQYEDMANRYRRQYWHGYDPSVSEVEDEYWRVVDRCVS